MTHTVLHIDASARRDGSESRALSAGIVARLAPEVCIRRDLADPLPLIDADWLAAGATAPETRSPEQVMKLALSETLIGELQAADTIVIGTPIYNFAVPAGLKAWIDQVARAGRTFRYTEAGPEGLLTGKRAIVAVASGGTRLGSEIDFASGYLRHMLGFMGITDVQFVAADGMAIDPDAARRKAQAEVEALAA